MYPVNIAVLASIVASAASVANARRVRRAYTDTEAVAELYRQHRAEQWPAMDRKRRPWLY